MIKWSKIDNTLCIITGTDRLLFWKCGTIMECSFPLDNRKFNIQKITWSNDSKKMLMSDKTDVIYGDLIEQNN
jgi:hypothetical protein